MRIELLARHAQAVAASSLKPFRSAPAQNEPPRPQDRNLGLGILIEFQEGFHQRVSGRTIDRISYLWRSRMTVVTSPLHSTRTCSALISSPIFRKLVMGGGVGQPCRHEFTAESLDSSEIGTNPPV